MLDLSVFVQALGADARYFDAELLPECVSTNALLLARAEAGAASGTVIVAERQTAGRGRRGRAWLSAPGDSLTFSLLWRFAPGTLPQGLSLAAGLALTQALAKVGAGDTALKWPNDVMKDGKKLSGILVELVPGAPHAAVIGIGMNLRLPAAMPEELRANSAALDLDTDPNILLAAILVELRATLEVFGAQGFSALREQWRARHAFEDAPIRLFHDFASPRAGICRGVDRDGALLFESDGRIERVLAGEISLRPA
ncbi:biotin--[acetyl-CoA-carboxylase] ligase [Sulfuricystis multivorans]|uniref:biotin--[acetyl-CoA-carboxylase] ligase n=1 Tax=Sulfuricystis multivorans TaxID=2211108 RepID=UPI000F83239A|nr:biotin--[acetyl-CoA-carboxylase] ligase [Sulfuricystis multivorans]